MDREQVSGHRPMHGPTDSGGSMNHTSNRTKKMISAACACALGLAVGAAIAEPHAQNDEAQQKLRDWLFGLSVSRGPPDSGPEARGVDPIALDPAVQLGAMPLSSYRRLFDVAFCLCKQAFEFRARRKPRDLGDLQI